MLVKTQAIVNCIWNAQANYVQDLMCLFFLKDSLMNMTHGPISTVDNDRHTIIVYFSITNIFRTFIYPSETICPLKKKNYKFQALDTL